MKNEIRITWHTDDVKHQAKACGVSISSHEAKEILYTLKYCHDASIGINWDVVASAIFDFDRERTAKGEK